jgi:hypothetical protein
MKKNIEICGHQCSKLRGYECWACKEVDDAPNIINDIAKIKIIEAVSKALETKQEHDVKAAESLLKSICFRERQSWLLFIFNELIPALNGSINVVDELNIVECQYCKKQLKNITGLKAHLGVKHQDMKLEWSGKF